MTWLFQHEREAVERYNLTADDIAEYLEAREAIRAVWRAELNSAWQIRPNWEARSAAINLAAYRRMAAETAKLVEIGKRRCEP
jgi:hypothetical protein